MLNPIQLATQQELKNSTISDLLNLATNTTLYKRIIQSSADLVAILVIYISYIIVLTASKPRIAYYTCDMSDVSFPNLSETIPFYALAIYCVIPALLFILSVEAGNAKLYPLQNPFTIISGQWRQYLITGLHAFTLFVYGLGITLLLTEILKNWVGSLRPYFLAVCNPSYSSISCTVNANTGTIYNSVNTGGSFCSGNSADIEEARKSFPSGHASVSFYSMMFIIIYLEARLILLRFRAIKSLLQVSAFIAALVTSVSRILDYKHRGFPSFFFSFLSRFFFNSTFFN